MRKVAKELVLTGIEASHVGGFKGLSVGFSSILGWKEIKSRVAVERGRLPPIPLQLDLGGNAAMVAPENVDFVANELSLDERKRLVERLASPDFLSQCSQVDLKRIRKAASEMLRRRFVRLRVPKYGGLGAKAASLEDIDKFFSGFLPEEYRFKVLFLTQAMLGLRIGEVVRLNLRDVDFEFKQIGIHTLKERAKIVDWMLLHEKLEDVLKEYVALYKTKIEAHKGYLFFAFQDEQCKTPYISEASARKKFGEVRERVGLTKTYGEREAISGRNYTPGKLYYFTSHSLRHSFARFLSKSGVPIEIAKHLLRHRDISSTQVYFVPDKQQVDATLNSLFRR